MSRGKNRECQIYYAKVSTSAVPNEHWIPVILSPISHQQEMQYNSDYVDPREAHLNYIFYPGRFPLNVISKALNVRNWKLFCDIFINMCNFRFIRDRLYIAI